MSSTTSPTPDTTSMAIVWLVAISSCRKTCQMWYPKRHEGKKKKTRKSKAECTYCTFLVAGQRGRANRFLPYYVVRDTCTKIHVFVRRWGRGARGKNLMVDRHLQNFVPPPKTSVSGFVFTPPRFCSPLSNLSLCWLPLRIAVRYHLGLRNAKPRQRATRQPLARICGARNSLPGSVQS